MNFGQWFGFSILLVSIYVLWQIRNLLLLVFTAVVLATALNRLVKWLQKFKIKRFFALIITVSLCLILLVIFVWLVVPPFIEQFRRLLELLPAVWSKIDWEIEALSQRLPEFLPQMPTRKELIAQLPPLQQIINNFIAFFSDSLTILLQLLLVVVLTLMMLANPPRYRKAFLTLFPSFYRRRADEILSQSEIALGNWLTGIAFNCLFIGIFSGIGLAILQVRLVLVHALLAGVFNFIPNIGPAASFIFPAMIAVLEAPWKVLAVLIWYIIIQNIETYWLSPTVMAKQVSLLPAVTLTAQLFFARMFGLLGLILALPLTVVAKTWIEEALFKDFLDKWNSPLKFKE